MDACVRVTAPIQRGTWDGQRAWTAAWEGYACHAFAENRDETTPRDSEFNPKFEDPVHVGNIASDASHPSVRVILASQNPMTSEICSVGHISWFSDFQVDIHDMSKSSSSIGLSGFYVIVDAPHAFTAGAVCDTGALLTRSVW